MSEETVRNEMVRIGEDTVVLALTRGIPGVRRKVKATDIVNMDDSGIEDESAIHVSKDILDAEELKEVGALLRATGQHVRSLAIPVKFLKGGMYLEHVALVPKLVEYLGGQKETLKNCVESFVARYPELIERRRTELGPKLFDPEDYPEAARIRDAFRLEWAFGQFVAPIRLKTISEAAYQREAKKLEQMFEQARADADRALCAEARGLVAHVVERLTPGDDGKRKVLRGSVGENLSAFLESFPFRNVSGSDDLKVQVARLRGIMAGVDATALRDSKRLREYVRSEMEDVKSNLDALVENAPARRVLLEGVA